MDDHSEDNGIARDYHKFIKNKPYPNVFIVFLIVAVQFLPHLLHWLCFAFSVHLKCLLFNWPSKLSDTQFITFSPLTSLPNSFLLVPFLFFAISPGCLSLIICSLCRLSCNCDFTHAACSAQQKSSSSLGLRVKFLTFVKACHWCTSCRNQCYPGQLPMSE